MKYFNSLPLISITDKSNNTKVYRNLMTRISVVPSVLTNPLLFYSYDIKESDTPEILADKYYGDSYRYWIIMLSNQLLDPQWDWPLNSITFENYVADKYDQLGLNANSGVKAYQKTITQKNLTNGITTTNKMDISQAEYNSLMESTRTLTFATESVEVTTTKNIQTYYQYEFDLNESKRNIKLLNKNYVNQLETEFVALIA